MSTRDLPSIDYLRQALRYEDGKLFWLSRPRDHFRTEHGWKICNTKDSGKEAGVEFKDGWGSLRRKVCLNGIRIRSSVIVWALHHGEWPSVFVDHKNLNTLDNRIENLRLATTSQNGANSHSRKRKSSSMLKGAYQDKRYNTWFAAITVNNKSIRLGTFNTPEEAHAAYRKAAKEFFGEFSREG